MRKKGQIRIIGGEWRSRILRFPLPPGLRPSPDFIRETVFNWLQMDIQNSRVLDLFAGSGAFGFEAASRGAAKVDMAETNPAAVKALHANCKLLNATDIVNIHAMAADTYLESCEQQYDLIILDPPYDSNHLQRAIFRINKFNILSENGLIYLESGSQKKDLPLDDSWHIIREKKCGQVNAFLAISQPHAHDKL